MRELLQQALDALNSCGTADPSEGEYMWYDNKMVDPAIAALEAELAKPEQEPTLFFGRAVYFADPRTGELAKPEQEPVAWNENVDEMPINTYCKAVVDWYSYSTDGDSFLEGSDVEVIIVKYKLDEDEDNIIFIHEGKNQYKNTSCEISKWKPLYTSLPRKEWVNLTSEELAQLTIDNLGHPTKLTAAIEAKLRSKNG